jgi:hypothetical protein
VGRGANGIAEHGQKLQEDGSGMGFAVRGQAAYGQPRDAVAAWATAGVSVAVAVS